MRYLIVLHFLQRSSYELRDYDSKHQHELVQLQSKIRQLEEALSGSRSELVEVREVCKFFYAL